VNPNQNGSRSGELDERAVELDERAVELEERAVELEERAVELEERAVELDERAVELDERAVELDEGDSFPVCIASEQVRQMYSVMWHDPSEVLLVKAGGVVSYPTWHPQTFISLGPTSDILRGSGLSILRC
jgi:hypothetical protein